MTYDPAEFSKRLAEAMRAMGLEARPKVLMTRFNSRYRGRSVSFQSASRWLRGEAVPKPDKLELLAELFRVEAHVRKEARWCAGAAHDVAGSRQPARSGVVRGFSRAAREAARRSEESGREFV